jgi:3-deoxy-D-manno-octulosonic-acid transferase
MWKLIYNILIHLFLPLFVLFSLTRPKIRKTLVERLLPSRVKTGFSGAFWIHAASVGEAVIAENLMNYVQRCHDDEKFVITTNTYYTRDLLRARMRERTYICSLPFDIPFSIKRLIGDAGFKVLIIVETEIWPNLIWFAKKRGIPVVIVNGRISDSTVKQYIRFSFFMKRVLADVDLVLAQSEEHRERYVKIGMDASKVVNAGNMKYYRELKEGVSEAPKGNIITFGSVKEKEIEVVAPVIMRLKREFPDSLIFVAPRELHLIGPLEEQFSESFDVMRYSVYRGLPDAKPSIVIVDTVGDLLGIYARSAVAFVGGSLAPYGGQNMLEPLFFGTPVIFGPYTENFREIAGKIVERGAGIMVATGEDLFVEMERILSDGALKKRKGDAGRNIVLEQEQVMKQVVDAISEVTWKNSPNS